MFHRLFSIARIVMAIRDRQNISVDAPVLTFTQHIELATPFTFYTIALLRQPRTPLRASLTDDAHFLIFRVDKPKDTTLR